ncbi:MAG: hypothetical protein DRP54_05605 [Spirochaetes bacterium]|nr:MAG: hypothetical protein DRP54_05605 [Spirochaetota bacterium]
MFKVIFMKRAGGISVFLFFLILFFLVSSCATQRLQLYKDGKPLKLSEYEKLALKEYTEGRYENAIKVYQAILKNYSSETYAVVWAWYEIGYCYYMMKNYPEAEKAFRKVINEYQDPAAKRLAQEMLGRIIEEKKS